MTRLSDAIIDEFTRCAEGKADWLPERKGAIDEEVTLFGKPEMAHKQLSLLANATVEALRRSRIPDIIPTYMMESSFTIEHAGHAGRMSYWLLCESDRAYRVEDDRVLGDRCHAAACVAERFSEAYMGRVVRGTYEDLASHFVGAVGGMDTSRPAILKVLGELKKLEDAS